MRRIVVLSAMAALIAALAWIATRDDQVALPRQPVLANTPAEARTNAPAPDAGAPTRVAIDPAVSDAAAVAAIAPPPTDTTFTVVVVDARNGQRVPDATVDVAGMHALTQALDELGATMHTPVGRRIRRAIAHRATTDESGEARLAAPTGRLMIEAHRDTRWGFTVKGAPPEGGRTTVTIGEDRDLQVQVCDATGTPRAGVPIALRRQTAPPPRLRYDSQATETEAPDGIGTFTHFQRRLRQGTGWHATFAFPVRGAPAIPVDAHTPARPPQRLALPPTGSLRITVRDEGGAAPKLDGLTLRLEARAGSTTLWPGGPWSRPRLDHDTGAALVPWLGLGLELTVSAHRGATVLTDATVPGPQREGETAVCEIVLAPEHTFFRIVRGRLVRNDGTPWPPGEVTAWRQVRPITTAMPRPQPVPVGADGAFTLTVERPLDASGSRTYELRGQHPNEAGQVATDLHLDQEIPPEGLDVGDVCLDHGPLLVGGTVLGYDRQPVKGARLRLRAHTSIDDREYWPHLFTGGTWETTENGRFRLYLRRGAADPGSRLRLDTSCDGYATNRGQDIAQGSADVVVLLPAAGTIAGSFALASGLTREDLLAVLHAEGTTGGDDPLVRAIAVTADGTFTVSELPVGAWTLTVRRRGVGNRPEEEPVVTVEGLQVVAAATSRDPRIQQLPIAALCASLRITVVDASSTPQTHATVTVLGGSRGRAAAADANGIVRVHTESLPVDLEVTAFGHRTQVLRGVDRDRTVTVQAGIPVVLCSGTQSNGTNPTWQLAVYLMHVDPDGIARRRTYGSAYPWDQRYFDGNGELAVSLPAPGVYRCDLQVFVSGTNRVGRGGRVELPVPLQVTVVEGAAEQRFELHIPADAVTRAVARANR